MVAIAWQLLLSRTLVPIPRANTLTLGAIIWCIYLIDHLLDTRKPPVSNEPLRHQFTRKFRIPFSILAALILLSVFTTLNRTFVLQSLPVFGLLICHFIVVHLLPETYTRLWPKELAVAAIFTLGVSTPIFFAKSAAPISTTAFTLAFFLLCLWNCTSIDSWERSTPTTHWLSTLQIPAAIACLISANFTSIRLMFALALAFLLSSLLALIAPKLSPLALRVAADALLLTPFIAL